MTTYNSTVVACIICSGAVLITDTNLDDTLTAIDKGTISDVLFRCTVCIRCDEKTRYGTSITVGGPAKNHKIPIGATMILNWSVYKNVSKYLRKYCKLYSYEDKYHVVENRLDIVHFIEDGSHIYEFYFDSKLSLEPGDFSNFFIRDRYRQVKKPRVITLIRPEE